MARTAGKTLDEFLATDDLHDIVVRHISIIGEAVRNLSDSFCESAPDVPWHEIVGMRNKLVHDYRDIDLMEIWEAIQSDIPFLLRRVNEELGA